MRVRVCGADASTLAQVAERMNTHSGHVHSVGFSPDGTRLVSGSNGDTIKIWGGAHCSHCAVCVCPWRHGGMSG